MAPSKRLEPRDKLVEAASSVVEGSEDKDVDPGTAREGRVAFGFAAFRDHALGRAEPHLRELQRVARRAALRLQHEVGAELVGRALELAEVLGRHRDVDVVVPGNEALVANGAEERAVGELEFDLVLGAEPLEAQEEFEEKAVKAPEVVVGNHGRR